MEINIKVLIASHFGQPVGGISVQNDMLVHSRMKDLVNLFIVPTSAGNRPFDSRGYWGILTVSNAFMNILNFVIAIVKIKPDIVDIGTSYGVSFLKHSIMALFARAMGVKVILTFHCSMEKICSSTNHFLKEYTRYIIRHSHGIVAISREWLALQSDFPKLRIRYIPNAIETKIFALTMDDKPIEDKYVDILFLGHIGREKGLYELVEAVAVLKSDGVSNINVRIYGEELKKGEAKAIKEQVYTLGLYEIIQFFAPIYGKEKIELLAESDIFVLPSYHEGMPLSILEAMASGLPVVASAVGGIPEQVVNEITGLLVPPCKSHPLANALARLIQERDLRIRMGRAGRDRVQKLFDIDNKANALYQFYKETNAV